MQAGRREDALIIDHPAWGSGGQSVMALLGLGQCAAAISHLSLLLGRCPGLSDRPTDRSHMHVYRNDDNDILGK